MGLKSITIKIQYLINIFILGQIFKPESNKKITVKNNNIKGLTNIIKSTI